MQSRIMGFLLLVLGSLILAGVGNAQQVALECPEGTLLEPWSNSCADVHDARDQARGMSATPAAGHNKPGLGELRRQKALTRSQAEADMPIPSGVGAGVVYNAGSLQAVNSGKLYTKMFFYPDGVSPSGYMDWLFTTATNRTEQTVEVVGIYGDGSGNATPGTLGIFDWSCSPGYPCGGGETGASWVWEEDSQQLACYLLATNDQGGHRQVIVQYLNSSEELDQLDPPLWRNQVTLWNLCTGVWDIVYQHDFRYNQKDCSLTNDCGWWGPIIETFAKPNPMINELGFQESFLVHDGIQSYLDPSETGFSYPEVPFVLFEKDPNRGFGAGNFRYSVNEMTVTGTKTNSYLSTQYSDNQYETLTEVAQGSTSALEHRWTFNLVPGSKVVFHVEAHRPANKDGDDFRFGYSNNGVSWTSMLTVKKSTDSNAEQTYIMPSGTQGTVDVRVVDTNRSSRKASLDSVLVDRLYFSSEQ